MRAEDLVKTLREAYEDLLPQLERLHSLLESGASGEVRRRLEARYGELSERRRRLALCLDILEGALIEDKGGAALGRHYLVILPCGGWDETGD